MCVCVCVCVCVWNTHAALVYPLLRRPYGCAPTRYSYSHHDDGEASQLCFKVEFETRTLLLAAESERDKEGWIMSLLTTHAAAVGPKRRDKVAVSLGFRAPEPTAIWALDDDGAPWYCRRPSLDDKGGQFLIWYVPHRLLSLTS